MENEHTEKICECELCGEAFNRAADLKTHLLYHKKQEGVPCLICGAILSHYYQLSLHIERKHEFEKSNITFTCDLCDEKYFTTTRLDYHMKNKHCGVHKCFENSCRSRFDNRDSMKKHVMSAHKRNLEVKLQISALLK